MCGSASTLKISDCVDSKSNEIALILSVRCVLDHTGSHIVKLLLNRIYLGIIPNKTFVGWQLIRQFKSLKSWPSYRNEITISLALVLHHICFDANILHQSLTSGNAIAH